ncbi:MAG: inorganic phosphate transporter [Phycisphaerae bacterium]|nr:inorganic phosphate transporter [Phycisphaerae bacterium]
MFTEIAELIQTTAQQPSFIIGAVVVGVVMLFWDTVEVGRNDAANLVNAVLGARILTRRTALMLAGVCVLLGASFSSAVMETARKSIFDPHKLRSVEQLLAIYASVYIVDTVLLYSFSAYGMPVSTTACLVFELLGASFALEFFDVVNWHKSGTVVAAIVCSILLSGVASFLIQRAARGAIGRRSDDLQALLLHGGWIGGGVLAGLFYFMILKGMGGVEAVGTFRDSMFAYYGSAAILVFLWGGFAILVHAALVVFKERAAKWLFPVLTILGMMCMAFAFGQNDLANCASPGLATLHTVKHMSEGMVTITDVQINRSWLVVCGCLMAAGMFTKTSQRVTWAAMRAGSAGDHVKLWAPRWCIRLATLMLRSRSRTRNGALAPEAAVTPAGKTAHYDMLRACVIMAVSASVIATASSLGLPVSTTYVAFAAIVATGMADRIFRRGDAALKLGRSIWVVFSWFMAAAIAAAAAGIVCRCVYHLGIAGMLLTIGVNLVVRAVVKKRSDAQRERVRAEAAARMQADEADAFEHE